MSMLAQCRTNQARRDVVDHHALRREPQGVAACQPSEPGFGGAVGDADRAGADASPDRGDIDDSALAPRQHAPQNSAEKGGLQIDRDGAGSVRSEEHTSELQSPDHLVCRLLLEKKKIITYVRVIVNPVVDSALLLWYARVFQSTY